MILVPTPNDNIAVLSFAICSGHTFDYMIVFGIPKIPGRTPHPCFVLYILSLAVRLCKGGEHAYNFFSNEHKLKHKHKHKQKSNQEKTGRTPGVSKKFRRFYFTVPRVSRAIQPEASLAYFVPGHTRGLAARHHNTQAQ